MSVGLGADLEVLGQGVFAASANNDGGHLAEGFQSQLLFLGERLDLGGSGSTGSDQEGAQLASIVVDAAGLDGVHEGATKANASAVVHCDAVSCGDDVCGTCHDEFS